MKLHNKDCYQILAELPDNSIDLIYTDPPYDVGIFKPGSGGSINNVMKLDQTLVPINTITNTAYDMYKFLDEAIRVMKGVNIYIWCNKKQLPKYMDYFVTQHKCLFDILIWNKTNALPSYYNKYLDDCEYCLYFHKNNPSLHPHTYEDAKHIYTSPINRENKIYKHPNIKPLAFVKSMLNNSCDKSFVVLDPFMGSGTTGVACKELGIDNFIGVEINKDYFDIANSRINNINVEIPKDTVKVQLF